MRITPNYKGYHYVMMAYELTRENRGLLTCVGTELYPIIAKHYETNVQAVERGIRTVVKLCYDEGLLDDCKNLPTTAQFIGMVWSVGPSRFLYM